MSSSDYVLQAEARDVIGKKVAQLRRSGKIPAVIYERGKNSEHIMAEINPLTKLWHEAGKNHVVSLECGGKKRLVMFKDVANDPVKGTLYHVAFHAIKQNEAVEADIPVEITGEVPAERQGYFLVYPNDVVSVKALPGDLPDKFELSAESLAEVGDMLKVEDIMLSDKFEILTEADRPLAIVEESRANVEDDTEATEGDEGEEASEVPSEHGGDTSGEIEVKD